jgi:hypothetical protein
MEGYAYADDLRKIADVCDIEADSDFGGEI